MKKLYDFFEKKSILVAVICAAAMFLWFLQMKISFFSEDFIYKIMTACVIIIMAAVSLPHIISSRGKELFKPMPIIFAVLLSVSATPYIINSFSAISMRVIYYVLFFLLFWLFFAGFSPFLKERSKTELSPCSDRKKLNLVFLGVFVFSIFGLCLLWWNYPNAMSPDSQNQWMQIHGEIPYSNIHAIAHTILLKILCSIYDSFSLAVLLNVISVALVYAFFSRLLYKKGVSLSWIFVLISLSLTNEFFSRVYIFPWKDTPYTACLAAITYITILLLDNGGKIKIGTAFLCGAAIAFTLLFRLNGIIAAAVCLAFFAYWLIKTKKIQSLLSLAAVCLVCIIGINVYSSVTMEVKKPENGFSIQVFGSGIAAVVANDGNITPEQQEKLDSLLSSEWMKEKYTPWNNQKLIWDSDSDPKFEDPELEIFNNNFVLDLGKNKTEVIKMYLSLLPSNLGICIKDVIYNTAVIWSINDARFYDCHVFMLALMLYAVLTLWKKKNGDMKYLAIFVCIVFNAVSIAISTTTNEKRYLLITFTLLPVLLPYIVVRNREEKTDSIKHINYVKG